MSKPRFFSAHLEEKVIELMGEEAHHLANVRRVRVGEQVELFDGAGQIVIGRVNKLNKKSAQIEVLERLKKGLAKLEVVVACALAKGSRWDWLIEKCVELGATKIWPVLFERSVVKGAGSTTQLEKWNRRALEAAKQCGRAYLPQIAQPRVLEKVLTDTNDNCLGVVGTLNESAKPILVVLEKARPERVALLVGPEGGLTEKEQALTEANGYEPVFLGKNTLRVETAAAGLLAAIRAWQDKNNQLSSG
ncbi:MAG: RsmE family RNA methyltransferase [Actinobacteria bacterium]|nr:RsmE family RNA methyltransferase [Actinomycetota bacterium]